MKKAIIILVIIFSWLTSTATVRIVNVWDGYFQFVDAENWSADITIALGDTVQWVPLDVPTMVHTITSTNIPDGALAFDQIWQAPADTFFQYVPQIVGLYEYECTPHAESFGMVGSVSVTGIVDGIADDALLEVDLLIYPNPAKDFIRFNESNIIYPCRIFTSKGKLVLSGTTSDMLVVSELAKGMYHVEIVGDKPRFIKFLKQ